MFIPETTLVTGSTFPFSWDKITTVANVSGLVTIVSGYYRV